MTETLIIDSAFIIEFPEWASALRLLRGSVTLLRAARDEDRVDAG